jgi:hypothetical protein
LAASLVGRRVRASVAAGFAAPPMARLLLGAGAVGPKDCAAASGVTRGAEGGFGPSAPVAVPLYVRAAALDSASVLEAARYVCLSLATVALLRGVSVQPQPAAADTPALQGSLGARMRPAAAAEFEDEDQASRSRLRVS